VQAAARRETARRAAAQLAVEQYRLGMSPALGFVQGLLQVQNLQAAEVQQQAWRAVVSQTRSVVDNATSTAAEAATASAEADRAAAASRLATVTVQQTAAVAQSALTAQQSQVAALAARRTQLLAQLATAQQISLALAEQRQQALAAAAARAAAEAAREQALAAAQAAAAAGSVDVPPGSGSASSVVAFARAQLGLPYVWGGAGPDNFDCSGLTMRAWEQAGVELPHFAADQYARSTPLSYRQLRPGDLVFWSHNGSPADIYHVALYLGDDTMIEAPRTGDVVKVASLWIMGTPNFYARP
jgi:cell wall-associated NlpC family hydrolase